MNPRAACRATGLAALIALACACSDDSPVDPAAVEVARIGDRIYSAAEFQRYLEDNLVAENELDNPGDEAAAVKSRLFDAFVEERLLLYEADRRELRVSDFEVEAYLGLADGAGDASVTRSDWEESSRRLKIEKLLEATVRDLPPVQEPRPASRRPAEAGGGRRLRLRSLMLETPELAAQVSREINGGRMTFDEALVSHASAPEQGMPIELSWEGLSEDHRRVLENLKPGQVSKPMDVAGGSHLFQIEAWLPEDLRDPDALAEEARLEMEGKRRAEALRALAAELRKNIEIRIYSDALPFRYVPDDSA